MVFQISSLLMRIGACHFMKFARVIVFAFVSSFSFMSAANQDDVKVILRSPAFLFDGNEDGKIGFMTDYSTRANFGTFVYSDEYHAWKFGIGLDGAIFAIGKNVLWRAGANFDALADMQNKNFLFRLGQTHYEVFSAFEFRLDESVVYLGYRHRCRHGADTTYSRIVMKSGPEIGFNGLFHLGPVQIISSSGLLAYIVGQNEDLAHQPRINLSSTVQAEYQPWEKVSIFASVGL